MEQMTTIPGATTFPSEPPPKKFPFPSLPLIIWEKATFFFEQLFLVVARTWLESRSGLFSGGPKFRFLAKKSDFYHTTPILVKSPFVALGETVHFPPWEQFFDFPFTSYSHFRKKKQLTRQKIFPLPTVRAPSASNSPSQTSNFKILTKPFALSLKKIFIFTKKLFSKIENLFIWHHKHQVSQSASQ